MQNNGASVPDQALAVPVEPVSRLGPTGFDPSRKIFGFIKDDLPDAPGKIGVAIVQKCDGEYDGELIDFRLCGGREETVAYLALYGMSAEPVWTAASAIEARRAETPKSGSVHESAGPKDDAHE